MYIFVFTADRTMASPSYITSDYDPKTDLAQKDAPYAVPHFMEG
jgi:hypothetical protein